MKGRPDTYNILDEELATTPASVLATVLGCAPSTVFRRRAREGTVFKGDRIPPPGRPVKFNWAALNPALSITENMVLTGCGNREYVGLKRREARKLLTLNEV